MTAAEEPVLSPTGQPIPIPPGEVAVGADGVILPWTAGPWRRWASSIFPGNSSLTPEGANRYIAPSKGVQAAVGAQDYGRTPERLEAANENVVQGTVDLIVMQRQAEMMQRALTVFHTEFNKFATEDLPRV